MTEDAPAPRPTTRARGPSTATVLGVLGLFVAVQVGALSLAAPFAGGGTVENSGNPAFGVVYLAGSLAAGVPLAEALGVAAHL